MRETKMKRIVAALVGLALAGGAVFLLLTEPKRFDSAALGPYQPNLANGRVLLAVGGCASCHMSPGQEDRTLLGGGAALPSPFGNFYPPNISPDPERGIGRWSEGDFVTAMTLGTSPDGRHYYPAFPFTSYQRMSVADLRDLFAVMKSLPVSQTANRSHDLPFPLTVRRGLGLWKLLALDEKPFTPDPAKSADINRGAYLVNGPGHCAECHSDRYFFGMIKEGTRLAGGPNPEGHGWVPNITQHADGLAKWSQSDIESLLTDGLTPDGDVVGGSMGSVVKNISQLPKADVAAIAAYLKSLPPKPGKAPKKG